MYPTKNPMDDYQARDIHHVDLDILALCNQFHLDVDTVSTKVNAYTLRLVNPQNPYGPLCEAGNAEADVLFQPDIPVPLRMIRDGVCAAVPHDESIQ